MSGLGGIFHLDGRPVDPVDLERMTDCLAHRGPDGSGFWNGGPVGLTHLRLWTTPESVGEKLPLVHGPGELVLTADARIDNREELLADLGLGDSGRDIGDGELILRAYQQWGERCPERILGDFAFALWDGRRRVLFCARDPMGVKPFYYYRSDRLFAFASEIKALLGVPGVPRRLEERRVADYLSLLLEDPALTFYKDILRLPPARTLTVGGGTARSAKYWSLDPKRELRLGSDGEYAEAFRDVFTRAVRCRLRSAYPVGSMLSGGLDSSSVVCVARRLLPTEGGGRLHTFSALFDDVRQCDERRYIRSVLAQDGLEPSFVRADRLSPLADRDRVFFHQDEPFCTPNLFMTWALKSCAHQKGVRVLLDGEGGDDTVSHGLEYLDELARAGRWLRLAGEVIGLRRHVRRPLWQSVRQLGLASRLPGPVHRAWTRWQRGNTRPRGVGACLHPDFARRVGMDQRFLLLRGKWFRPPRDGREGHWRGLTSGLTPYVLEVADRAAAAFGLEPRYPFLDRRLVEFCLALPPEQKLRHGWTRAVMRRGLATDLPGRIRRRGDKSDLSPNFNRSLLTFERRLLDEVILGDTRVIEPYVHVPGLRRVYQRYAAGEGRCQDRNGDAMAVWSAVTLALWLRHTGLTE